MISCAGRKSRATGGRDVECVEGIALDPLADEGAHHSDQLIGRICGVRRDGGRYHRILVMRIHLPASER